MKMQLYSRLIAPCVMFVLLIFSGHQGYVVFKEYRKAADPLPDHSPASPRPRPEEQTFALFQPAVKQPALQQAAKRRFQRRSTGLSAATKRGSRSR